MPRKEFILLISKIEDLDEVTISLGCTDEVVTELETSLGLRFPTDYREYLKKYGYIEFGDHEWTGIGDVVDTTLKARNSDSNFPEKCFVLEEIKGVQECIIVSERGFVFLWDNNSLMPLCTSIGGYLDTLATKN